MLAAIINTLKNCFKIPELKSRLIFTLVLLGVCRLASLVPVPGIDFGALQEFMARARSTGANSLMGMYSLFTGGGFENCALGALGIMPYISATIILQLLTAFVPTLSKLSREEGGRTKLVQYGRYLTVILCLGQGLMMAIAWEHPSSMFTGFVGKLVLTDNVWWFRIETTLLLTTGTMLLMWLGEQITDRGVGNGVSLVITIGILARLPKAVQGLVELFFPGAGIESKFNLFYGVALIILLIAVVAGVVAVTQAQRKVPVQYAQRAIGRKVVSGGQTSFMPLRVNYAGVMPIIFAQSILMVPGIVLKFMGNNFHTPWLTDLSSVFEDRSAIYLICYGLMILFFSYFWVATQFNEIQIADDMKKNGGYIPGVRPGQATSDYLHRAMSRITFAGAVFLTIIAIIPIILGNSMGVNRVVTQFFGGTSLLILVGVMLDTMRQMETYLLNRHYDGFLKKGKLKGRF